MPITTSVQPKQKWRNIIFAFISLVLGIWGFYDWGIVNPRAQAATTRFDELNAQQIAFEKLREEQGELKPEEIAQFESLEREFKAAFPDAKRPTPPASYDNFVDFWMFGISCGVLSTAMFLWFHWKATRKTYQLNDDGSIEFSPSAAAGSAPGAGTTWASTDIADIDMSKWMAKSKAWLVHQNGTRVLLDDFIHKNIHLIVGAVASRFYPEEWDAEAKIIKPEETEPAPDETPAPETGDSETGDSEIAPETEHDAGEASEPLSSNPDR